MSIVWIALAARKSHRRAWQRIEKCVRFLPNVETSDLTEISLSRRGVYSRTGDNAMVQAIPEGLHALTFGNQGSLAQRIQNLSNEEMKRAQDELVTSMSKR